MPWHIESDTTDCGGYAVIKTDDGSLAGCHDTRTDAEAQVAALYASEADKADTPPDVKYPKLWIRAREEARRKYQAQRERSVIKEVENLNQKLKADKSSKNIMPNYYGGSTAPTTSQNQNSGTIANVPNSANNSNGAQIANSPNSNSNSNTASTSSNNNINPSTPPANIPTQNSR